MQYYSQIRNEALHLPSVQSICHLKLVVGADTDIQYRATLFVYIDQIAGKHWRGNMEAYGLPYIHEPLATGGTTTAIKSMIKSDTATT